MHRGQHVRPHKALSLGIARQRVRRIHIHIVREQPARAPLASRASHQSSIAIGGAALGPRAHPPFLPGPHPPVTGLGSVARSSSCSLSPSGQPVEDLGCPARLQVQVHLVPHHRRCHRRIVLMRLRQRLELRRRPVAWPPPSRRSSPARPSPSAPGRSAVRAPAPPAAGRSPPSRCGWRRRPHGREGRSAWPSHRHIRPAGLGRRCEHPPNIATHSAATPEERPETRPVAQRTGPRRRNPGTAASGKTVAGERLGILSGTFSSIQGKMPLRGPFSRLEWGAG